ncbi:MAG: hypothetical protein ACODAG_09930, partial [Myxococcota bacterium]
MGAVQLTIDGAPVANPALSQFFTPPEVACRLVRWSLEGARWRVRTALEPSAGSGMIAAALLESGLEVEAHELDPAWVADLRRRFPELLVVEGDFLRSRAPGDRLEPRFDLCVMNPPYETLAKVPQDAAHVAHAMRQSDRVTALLRTHALHTPKRVELVWSHVGTTWWVSGLAHFTGRPFAGQFEYTAFRLTRFREEAEA